MLSRLLRRYSSALLAPLVRRLRQARITPSQLTLAGLARAIRAGAFAAADDGPAAAAAILLSGLLDSLDGELARASGCETRFGAFLDSIADHYGDFALYAGIAWQSIRSGNEPAVLLTLAALFGSLVGSHIRSRAGMLGIETRDVGLFTRAERIGLLCVGLASGWMVAALALLALGTNVSALQRLARVASPSRGAS